MNDDQFYSIVTSKRDEGLAHITSMIEWSGVDKFCGFLLEYVKPMVEADELQSIIGHMAIIGSTDALLAHRDRMAELTEGE